MSAHVSRRWLKRFRIVAIVVAVLLIAGFGGYRLMMGYFMRQYYQGAMQPQKLSASALTDAPDSRHLTDIPWIASSLPTCQSTSLQMIAAQHGILRERGYYDFLMGFTYGASTMPNGQGFVPFTDPEPGFGAAAPVLGLVRRYYITNDGALYLRALRYYLSQGVPVRVPLDMGVLYGSKAGIAHSEVLVGYGRSGFNYYETVCLAPATCQAGQRAPGDPGLRVDNDRLLAAVSALSKLFGYPWCYSLTVFEPDQTAAQDLKPIWARNGQLLLGGAKYGPKQGADAIEALAAAVEKAGPRYSLPGTQASLELAAALRHDDAVYLRQSYPSNPDLVRAADLLERAAGSYGTAAAAMKDGIADRAEAGRLAGHLRDAAAAEREAGQAFMRQGS